MSAAPFHPPTMKTASCALRLLLALAGFLFPSAHLQAEIEGLPVPGAPRNPQVIAPRERTLPNGLRIVVVERPGLPLVSASLLLRSGAEADPSGSAGLASFTAALLTQGTEARSATQIAREVEALGARIEARAKWDASVIELTTLSAHLAPAFGLLADIARHPRFAPEEIERLRRQSLDELRVALEEPRTVARAAASRVLLGHGLYAHSPGGTLASLQRLSRPEITTFHATHYTPDQAQLILAGNVTAADAFALVEKIFGSWTTPPATKAPQKLAYAPATTPRTVLIDMPKAGQASVYVATPAVPRSADDYFAGLVANTILGGGYTSWLNQEIRVKRGLTYGARSTFEALRAGGTCIAGCQTKNGSAAEVALLLRAQLTRLGTTAAEPDFFAARQAVLTGDFASELETNQGYVARLVALAAGDRPIDEFADFPARIRAVTPEAARDFAARHYPAEKVSIIIAGRAAEIARPLRAAFPQLEVIPQSALDLDSPTLRRPGKR